MNSKGYVMLCDHLILVGAGGIPAGARMNLEKPDTVNHLIHFRRM
jgi:hypothetical protein